MLVKVVYNSEKDKRFIEQMRDTLIRFEEYDTKYLKDRKQGYKIKNAFGARLDPFVGIFTDDNKPIKGFYTEAGFDLIDLTSFYVHKLKEDAKKGYIWIQKEGDEPHYGFTSAFVEGLSCRISNFKEWYVTSMIQSIDWKNNKFKTLNSTYDFKFNEDSKQVEQPAS